MFIKVGNLVGSLSTRSRAPEAIVALQVRQIAKNSFRNVCSDLGEEVMANAKVKSFKNGVLTIAATNLLATELSGRSGDLVDDINRTVGKKIVGKIVFRVS